KEESSMDIGEMVVHGWKFHLVNDELSITSEQDPNVHVELEAKAAYSLLDYLYQYRDDLAVAALGSQVLEEGTSRVTSGSASDTSGPGGSTGQVH
ncbi:MAG: hypothetical protein ACJ8DI_28670, partial [Ktedonobacteraceae bacterium]